MVNTCLSVRAYANRSGVAGWAGVPAVARPPLAHEAPHDDDHRREGDPERDDDRAAFSAPDQLLVGAVSRVRVTWESYPRSRCTVIAASVVTRASRVGASSGASWRLAGAATVPSGIPAASTARERLSPCLPRSTGLRPATSPPHGALVMQQSMLDRPGPARSCGRRREAPG